MASNGVGDVSCLTLLAGEVGLDWTLGAVPVADLQTRTMGLESKCVPGLAVLYSFSDRKAVTLLSVATLIVLFEAHRFTILHTSTLSGFAKIICQSLHASLCR